MQTKTETTNMTYGQLKEYYSLQILLALLAKPDYPDLEKTVILSVKMAQHLLDEIYPGNKSLREQHD